MMNTLTAMMNSDLFSTVMTVFLTSLFLGIVAYLVRGICTDLLNQREAQLKALKDKRNTR